MSIYGSQDQTHALQSWQFVTSYSTNRLTLDSLRQYSSDSNAHGQTYRFFYNAGLPDANPNHTAINSQDLWGYYNGATNSVFPQGYTTQTPSYGQITLDGADRHADSVYTEIRSFE